VERREFIALLGSAAAVQPLGARAESPVEHILYFTGSAGYRHEVLRLSKAILTQLGGNSVFLRSLPPKTRLIFDREPHAALKSRLSSTLCVRAADSLVFIRPRTMVIPGIRP
jgi:hypothetical protein